MENCLTMLTLLMITQRRRKTRKCVGGWWVGVVWCGVGGVCMWVVCPEYFQVVAIFNPQSFSTNHHHLYDR